ncbi:MAG: hypothetical protein OXI33_07250, partial [Chloroflexota bacterium]|nr:hypothetical protein [Chloroflexota bacterium]
KRTRPGNDKLVYEPGKDRNHDVEARFVREAEAFDKPCPDALLFHPVGDGPSAAVYDNWLNALPLNGNEVLDRRIVTPKGAAAYFYYDRPIMRILRLAGGLDRVGLFIPDEFWP